MLSKQGTVSEAAQAARDTTRQFGGSTDAQAAVAGAVTIKGGGNEQDCGAAAARIVRERGGDDSQAQVAGGRAAAKVVAETGGSSKEAAVAGSRAALNEGASMKQAAAIAGEIASDAVVDGTVKENLVRAKGQAGWARLRARQAGLAAGAAIVAAGGSLKFVVRAAENAANAVGVTVDEVAEIAGMAAADALLAGGGDRDEAVRAAADTAKQQGGSALTQGAAAGAAVELSGGSAEEAGVAAGQAATAAGANPQESAGLAAGATLAQHGGTPEEVLDAATAAALQKGATQDDAAAIGSRIATVMGVGNDEAPCSAPMPESIENSEQYSVSSSAKSGWWDNYAKTIDSEGIAWFHGNEPPAPITLDPPETPNEDDPLQWIDDALLMEDLTFIESAISEDPVVPKLPPPLKKTSPKPKPSAFSEDPVVPKPPPRLLSKPIPGAGPQPYVAPTAEQRAAAKLEQAKASKALVAEMMKKGKNARKSG